MAIDAAILSSPRSLTLQHANDVRINRMASVAAATGDDDDDDEVATVTSHLEQLPQGQAKLYSFFGPALAGGKHSITSKHSIQVGAQETSPTTTKDFIVSAPQYVLPEGIVHSCFPPSGSTSQVETLPHILFNDPFLPWERIVTDAGDTRERMPWLALLVFSQEELQLDATQLAGDTNLFKGTKLESEMNELKTPIQSNADFAVNMAVQDIAHIVETSPCISPVPRTAEEKTRANVIFVKTHLFDLLTRSYDEFGQDAVNLQSSGVSRYKYLAHVRHSNAAGMKSVGNDDGLYSTILSHRIGPLHQANSSRAVVHLVSLEGWQDTVTKGLTKDYVMLCSLYSWSYTVLGSDAMNVAESLRNIGGGASLLRPPSLVLDAVAQSTAPQAARIHARMRDGYTLTRYQTQTGETTAAIMRGALTPTIPPTALGDSWTSLSFSGADLQIFDEGAGLMDLTYSAAWNLGKTLALADQVFTTALSRIRNITQSHALDHAKIVTLASQGTWKSKDDTVASLPSTMMSLNALARGELGDPTPTNAPGRIDVAANAPIDLSLNNPELLALTEEETKAKIWHFAGSSDVDGDELFKFFNELNSPNSMDWTIVLRWVLDKMFLFGIPAQYLLIEPSWLPLESLRFFHIDPHWVDALIDGALSIANHINRTDDMFRRSMKGAFNAYFRTVDPEVGYRPQIPTQGFFLRSHLVEDFPDLLVTAPFPGSMDTSLWKPGHERAPILRHERLADDTLLCLLDREPGQNELKKLVFTQPAHQQTFIVGSHITDGELKLSIKRAYSKEPESGEPHTYETIAILPFSNSEDATNRAPEESPTDGITPLPDGPVSPPPAPTRQAFLWGAQNEARFLNMSGLVAQYHESLADDTHKTFEDDHITSALVGYQLSCPMYELSFESGGTSIPMASIPASGLGDDVVPQLMMLEARPLSTLDMPPASLDMAIDHVPKPQSMPLLSRDVSPNPFPDHTPMLPSFQVREVRNSLVRRVPVAAFRPLKSSAVMALSTARKDPTPFYNGSITTALNAVVVEKPVRNPDGPLITTEALAPTFEWKVYALGKFRKSISCGVTEPQDLVFSIRLLTGATYDYDLQYVQVSVPVGPIDRNDINRTLFAEYRGPGPVMLSNLRFNVIMTKSEKEGYLDFTLYPRSTKNKVRVGNLRDCSFLLPLVVVNKYAEAIRIPLEHVESYEESQSESGEFQVQLVP